MASATDTQIIGANQKVLMFKHEPGDANPNDVSWQDMRDFENFMAGYVRASGTGALDTFRILANANSDGSGTDVVVKTSAAQPDAVNDVAFIEVTAQEVREQGRLAGINTRYVSLQIELATGTDKGAVTYVFSGAKHAQEDLTADSIA